MADSVADSIDPAPAIGGDDVRYALRLARQDGDKDPTGAEQTGGYVLLVRADGQYRAVESAAMDMGLVRWDASGVHVADSQRDVVIDSDGLHAVPSPKADSQFALFSTDAGTIGLYNHGFTQAGYQSEVVTTRGSRATAKLVEGSYFIAGMCDGQVYGVSQASGPYATTDDPVAERVMFAQLTGAETDKERVLGYTRDFMEGALVPDAPCQGGKLFHFSTARAGEAAAEVPMVLSRWDVATGEYHKVALVDEHGAPMLQSAGELFSPSFDSASLVGHHLEWYGMGNAIMSTDIRSGRTTKRFELAGRCDKENSSFVTFTPTRIVQLIDHNVGTDIRIAEYDRATGKLLRDVALPGVSETVHSRLLYPRSLAVRPD